MHIVAERDGHERFMKGVSSQTQETDMISTQIIQSTLNDTTAITGASAAIFERGGHIIASKGDMDNLAEMRMDVFLRSQQQEMESDEFYFEKADVIGSDTIYAAAVRKDSDNALMTVKLLASQVRNLLSAQKERIDKDDFVKNLILDNLLQIDIFNRSKKLGLDYKAPRVVFVIECVGREIVYDTVRALPFFGRDDFMTGVDEGSQIVVHEIADPDNIAEELKNGAEEMLNAITELGLDAYVSYGSVIHELKDVSLSYKEARLAHDVRKIFYEDSRVISYDRLGIGRLIYQLPINLCRMFMNEIFGGRSFDEFDEETLTTITKFFENNLNVSETSRQLFIHRNTLVYRLDKLQKTVGLDLRVFDDAITFKIALMVVKYIDYMDRLDY